MIKQIHVGGPYGDETSDFDIKIFPQPITVAQFIEEVMITFPKEWGDIYLGPEVYNGDKIVKYKHGEYNITNLNLYEKNKNKIIKSAKGHGGWSLMTYELEV